MNFSDSYMHQSDLDCKLDVTNMRIYVMLCVLHVSKKSRTCRKIADMLSVLAKIELAVERPMPKEKRVTLALGMDAYNRTKVLRDKCGWTSFADVFRNSFRVFEDLFGLLQRGHRIVIVAPDGSQRSYNLIGGMSETRLETESENA